MPGVERTMREYKRGTLKSGSGKKVTSRRQAVAIAMSQEKKMRKPAPKKNIRRPNKTGNSAAAARKESKPVPLGGAKKSGGTGLDRINPARLDAMRKAAALRAAQKTGTPAKRTGGMGRGGTVAKNTPKKQVPAGQRQRQQSMGKRAR